MKTYEDINKDSGIKAYDYGDDFIEIEFKHGKKTYTYSIASGVSKEQLEEMKKLADQGDGLNSYIQLNVKKLFE